MREPYETPTIEIIEFDSEEVITMSSNGGDNNYCWRRWLGLGRIISNNRQKQ